MKIDWPNKTDREAWEIEQFIEHYRRIPSGRDFEIVSRGEKPGYTGPDYIVRDKSTGKHFGVELTSAYLDDYSVGIYHKIEHEDVEEIPYDRAQIELYLNRLVETVISKIEKSSNYDKSNPLILSVYANEYISIYLRRNDLEQMVSENSQVFDHISPFTEVVFWSFPTNDAMSVRPELNVSNRTLHRNVNEAKEFGFTGMKEKHRLRKRSFTSRILTVIFIILAFVTFPGFYNYFYRVGAGYAIGEFLGSENLPGNNVSDAQRKKYITRAEDAGLKCAVLMALGIHVPLYLFVLITIGLLSRSISHKFRIFLRLAFFSVWTLGMLFLSVGIGYYGQAPQIPESLGPAFLFYLVLLVFFGLVLGIGKLIQRAVIKHSDQLPQLAQDQTCGAEH